MSFAFLRLSALASALLLLAGCGGGSGGGGSTSGGGNSTTVTFTVTGGTPTAVAAKVGSGAFTTATLTSGKLTLSLPSGTTNFAVAFACPLMSFTTTNPQDQETVESVFEATTLDGTSFTEPCPVTSTTGATGTLTGSVDASAIPGASFLNILAQNGTAQSSGYLGASSGNFSFAAPAGTDRVEVVAYSLVLNGYVETLNLVAAKSFSSQTVPGALNGGNSVVLGVADETTPKPLSYSNIPSGYSAPSTLIAYGMSGAGGFLIANAATSEYSGLPVGAVESGDSYIFNASAHNPSNALEQAAVLTTSASAGPESFTFPPAWSYAGPTPAARPSFDLFYAGFSGKTGVYDGVGMAWSTGSTTVNIVLVTATGNYLNGSTSLAIPDLSGLTGFIAPPASGTGVVWTAEISQGSYPSLQPLPSNGTVTVVSNGGNYSVP